MRKTSRLAAFGRGVIAPLLLFGCIVQQASVDRVPGKQTRDHRIRGMLIGELAKRASAHPAPDSTTTRFVDVPSEVVPHLIYHWGMYYPRTTPEGQFSAIVAERGAHLALVTTPSDWIEASGMFTPGTADELMTACREMILVTNSPRSPNQPIEVFTNRKVIDTLPQAVPDPEFLRRTLSPPEVTGNSSGWQTRLWVVHRRVVRRYECRLGNSGGHLSIIDSLPGYGFY